MCPCCLEGVSNDMTWYVMDNMKVEWRGNLEYYLEETDNLNIVIFRLKKIVSKKLYIYACSRWQCLQCIVCILAKFKCGTCLIWIPSVLSHDSNIVHSGHKQIPSEVFLYPFLYTKTTSPQDQTFFTQVFCKPLMTCCSVFLSNTSLTNQKLE